MKLEFASIEIGDIWEAQVDLVAYGVFSQQKSYHVSTYTIVSTNKSICAGTKNAMHCS